MPRPARSFCAPLASVVFWAVVASAQLSAVVTTESAQSCGETLYPENDRSLNGTAAVSNFGWAVAMSGNRLVVGEGRFQTISYGDPEPGGGAVHVYDTSDGGLSWVLDVTLAPPEDLPPPEDEWALTNFGIAVAIDRDVIVVGSRTTCMPQSKKDCGYYNRGYVFVYKRNSTSTAETWELKFQVAGPASTSTAKSSFGYTSVSVDMGAGADKGLIVVGAYEARKAYVYYTDDGGDSWSGWPANEEVECPEPDKPLQPPYYTGDFFGHDVAVNSADGVIVVSAHRAQRLSWRGFLSGAGKVYVFKLGATSQQWEHLQTFAATLEADDTSDKTEIITATFGYRIAISGEWIVVGAPGDKERSKEDVKTGAVYVFQKTNDGNYTQRAKIMGGEDHDVPGTHPAELFGITAVSRRVRCVRAEFAPPAQVRSR